METIKDLGKYFWRGGKKIELEKEEEFFTAIIKDETELERIKTLSGVLEVKKVQNKIFKVKIAANRRDKAMLHIRSKELKGVCHHAYRPSNATNTRYYLTDQVIVKFIENTANNKIKSIISEAQVRILKKYPSSPKTYLIQVMGAAGKNPIKVSNALAEHKEVDYAEPNLINRFRSFYTPSDTLFEQQWHLRAWDGAEVIADADVSATEAWDITRGKREVVIAVIDDGFDLSHPDFTGPGKIVHPKDYVDGDAHPFPVTSHDDYHGTPCAGVALAEENGQGVVGIAPGCAFMPVRFPLSADDDLLWEIFDFAGKHADVISCSWGPSPAYAPLGQLLTDKFHQLTISGGPRKKGCLIFFAAGNYNAPLDDSNNTSFIWYHPYYGLVETQGPILNGTATHPDVIAVASSTSLNKKAAYSNWGKEISICSPSNNFHPTDRNSPVRGLGIWTTDNEEFGSDFTGGSRFTGHFGGTSSATPLAAGVAALVISANFNLTASEVKQILQETADKIVDNDPDPVLGHTKGNYDDNNHSEWFGYGRVNASKAVQHALDLHETNTGITELNMSAEAYGNLAAEGATKLFKITLGSKLGFTLQGPDGEDFDLYVQKDTIPTTEEYDGIGYSNSANEKVTINPAQTGDYYVMVRSYRGSGDFNLKIEFE